MFPKAKLGPLTTKVGSGATPRGGASVYTDEGVAFIRSQNVLDFRMKLDDVARLTDDAAHILRGVTVEVGDVLLNITGDSIARCCVVDEDVLPARVSQHVAIIRTKKDLRPRYLQYVLLEPGFKSHLVTISDGGGTRKALTKAMIESLEIPVPSRAEQEAIAEVLGALDDKIAANAQVIQKADELSRARFQAVAVTGDEVPLSSLARFVNGRAYTKNATGTGRVVVRIAELNSGIGASTVWNDIEVPDDNTARPGDLLFAWSGSLTAARWYRSEAIVNQHIFKVVPNPGVPMWLVNQAVHATLDEFKAIAQDKATTMGHIQRHHLDEPVKIPTSAEIKELDGLMAGLWEAALAAEIENLKLTSTRDELLPLLMSGKVRVKDAEKTVEGVL